LRARMWLLQNHKISRNHSVSLYSNMTEYPRNQMQHLSRRTTIVTYGSTATEQSRTVSTRTLAVTKQHTATPPRPTGIKSNTLQTSLFNRIEHGMTHASRRDLTFELGESVVNTHDRRGDGDGIDETNANKSDGDNERRLAV
jgi:hypothetical protein